MRILHVLDHSLPVQSGYSLRSQSILREQRNLGWETVQITSPKHGPFAAPLERVHGCDFRRVASSRTLDRVPVLNQLDVVLSLRTRLKAIVAETQPDIIHAHSPCLNALAAIGLGKPFVYELRSSWEDAAVSSGTTSEGSLRYRASRALETYVLHRADATTTLCEGLRAEILSRGVPADRVTVIPNAVDVDDLTRRSANRVDLRTRFGLEGNCVLGFIGSFFAWEGLPLLVEALPQILQDRSDARLLLVGGGPDEGLVRAAVARLGLEEFVIFAGQLRHDEIAAAYEAVDILVYPRMPIRLTEMVTPLKPLEAMAFGKALVASDVGGHRELVRDGVTGVLFRAGDKGALAREILRVAADGQVCRALEAAGPRFVREERAWAKVVRRYEPVYRSLLGRTGTVTAPKQS